MRISGPKSRGDPMTCKKCGGLSNRVMTFPKSVENEGCSVYQCLDCKFVEWLPQDKNRRWPAISDRNRRRSQHPSSRTRTDSACIWHAPGGNRSQ